MSRQHLLPMLLHCTLPAHRQAVGLVRRVGILAHQNAQNNFRQPEQYILPLYYILPLWWVRKPTL
ncbi:MAG: hypothetical protein IKZ88_06005 [Neisseriaceae bacterium]|nr:hypothetical protein [Neisseriaceae bacterium]